MDHDSVFLMFKQLDFMLECTFLASLAMPTVLEVLTVS